MGCKIVGIAGVANAGKTTLAHLLQPLISDHGYRNICLLQISSPIKAAAEAILRTGGWKCLTYEKEDEILPGYTVRNLCQDIGECIYGTCPAFWLAVLERRIFRLMHDDGFRPCVILLDDLRRSYEAQWVRRAGGKVIRLRRLMKETQDKHPTEAGLREVPDDLIDFDVPEDLDARETVRTVWDHLNRSYLPHVNNAR